jgi:hypothetical protein
MEYVERGIIMDCSKRGRISIRFILCFFHGLIFSRERLPRYYLLMSSYYSRRSDRPACCKRNAFSAPIPVTPIGEWLCGT